MLAFVAIVDDRIVRQYGGPPFDAASFVLFAREAARLGGSERALQDALAETPEAPETLARAGAWYDARARRVDGKRYWDQLAARADLPAELRADAAWHGGATGRRGTPPDPGAALQFAAEHAGTSWALHALDVAVVVGRLPAAAVAPVLQLNFERERDDVAGVGMLTWTALGANLTDDALACAERGVQLTESASPREARGAGASAPRTTRTRRSDPLAAAGTRTTTAQSQVAAELRTCATERACRRMTRNLARRRSQVGAALLRRRLSRTRRLQLAGDDATERRKSTFPPDNTMATRLPASSSRSLTSPASPAAPAPSTSWCVVEGACAWPRHLAVGDGDEAGQPIAQRRIRQLVRHARGDAVGEGVGALVGARHARAHASCMAAAPVACTA